MTHGQRDCGPISASLLTTSTPISILHRANMYSIMWFCGRHRTKLVHASSNTEPCLRERSSSRDLSVEQIYPLDQVFTSRMRDRYQQEISEGNVGHPFAICMPLFATSIAVLVALVLRDLISLVQPETRHDLCSQQRPSHFRSV